MSFAESCIFFIVYFANIYFGMIELTEKFFSSAAECRFLFYFYVLLFCIPACLDRLENIMRIFSDLTKFLPRFSFSVSLSP